MHLDDSPDPEKVMELMQEEDRRSVVRLLALAVGFSGILFFMFLKQLRSPLHEELQQHNSNITLTKLTNYLFGFPRNLRYYFKFESKHFVGLESI